MNIANTIFLIIVILFWAFLIYYSILAIAGILYRIDTLIKKPREPERWPSVDIFIPAYNEEKVLFQTLDAMANIEYPGHINIYVLNDNSTDKTGEIADYYARLFPYIHHISVPEG
ncbi:MAG: glycosyltransferase, partial [Dictyoglomi bacterium]|nr:glycosyltransferase [Dictyoglomota bacterium]